MNNTPSLDDFFLPAPNHTVAEYERQIGQLKKILNEIIAVSDAQKNIEWCAYRNYEDSVFAAIEKAKKELNDNRC